jgi:hypothetical protein
LLNDTCRGTTWVCVQMTTSQWLYCTDGYWDGSASVEGVPNYRFSLILARRQVPYVVVWIRTVTCKYRKGEEIVISL